MLPLVLASSSVYRKELLHRLDIPFESVSPDINETPLPGEPPEALVERLALEKTMALQHRYPRHLIIGSDQVAVLEGRILGKPLSIERAVQQLTEASGKRVVFFTGLALLNSQSGRWQKDHIPFTVCFRELNQAAILRYVMQEKPLDCAGSFKAEGLGVSLFSRTEGEDVTSLIGLPLIRLIDMLAKEGIVIP